MFLDKLLVVSDAQTVTAADTDLSDYSIDTGMVDSEVGTGEEIGFGVSIDTLAVLTGGETYTFQVIESAAAALSGPVVLTSRLMAATDLVAGARFFLPIPIGKPLLQYLGLQVVKAGAASSVTFTAWLTSRSLFNMLAKAYPSGYTIS
jgi:hypothetical protein